MTWHQLDTVDASFFTTAPILHRYPVKLAVPPERVWQSLACERSVAEWGPTVKSVRWTSSRPFGIGTTREVVTMLGVMTLREEFFRWDDGAGYSFQVRESTRGLFRRFAEDYALVPDGTGTLFTWTVAAEPAPRLTRLLTAGAPVSKAVLGQLPTGARRYFAAHP